MTQDKEGLPATHDDVANLSETTVLRLVEGQTRDQAIKLKELEIRQQELENQSRQASEVLGAQLQDRGAIRSHIRRIEQGKLLFVLLLAAMLLGACLYLSTRGPEAVELAKEILKMVGTFVAGGAAGYGARAAKGEKEE